MPPVEGVVQVRVPEEFGVTGSAALQELWLE